MSVPQMVEVQSSTIRAFGYDATTSELLVSFKSGKTYAYANVPAAVVSELESADSKGSYFGHNIRDTFQYRLLDDVEVEEKMEAKTRPTPLRDLIAAIEGGIPVFHL